MISSPTEFVLSLIAGAVWAGSGVEPWFESVIRYLGSAWPMWCLFLIGIALGALFFGRRKSNRTEGEAENVAVVETLSTGDVSAESAEAGGDPEAEQLIAKLEAELAASRQLDEEKAVALESLGTELESAQRELADQRNRFDRLSDSLKEVSALPNTPASLANARAPVIYLNELVRSEQQHLAGCLERLRHWEDRLDTEGQRVWHCAEEVAPIQAALAKYPPDANPGVGEAAGRIAAADEQLRVFHQNVEGCLQRIALAKSRLESEAKQLDAVAAPVAEAESALAKLAAIEDRADHEAIEAALAEASMRLSESQVAIAYLENGIEREISELTGRIDWLVNDSPKHFVELLGEFNESGPLEAPAIEEQAGEARRLLESAKQILAGIELGLEPMAAGEREAGCGKHRIAEALDQAAQSLRSISIPAATEEETGAAVEAAEKIAGLEEQLNRSEEQAARLAKVLKSQSDELIQLQETLEERRAAGDEVALRAEDAGESGDFVRRLLGLGPGEEGEAGPLEAPAMAASGAVTLAEAQEILGELRLASTNGSGNGGHGAEAPVAEADSPPAPIGALEQELEQKDAELVHLRKTASSQQERIDELERTIVELRETIPLNFTPAPAIVPASPPKSPAEGSESQALIEGVTPGRLVESGEDELVIFRGNDLSTWDSDYRGPDERLAVPLERLPENLRYLRLRRLDSGDSVVIPITRQELLDGASNCGLGCGWSGRRERYFGGDHLGIYDQSLPREVETKFGAGGWGFGHVESIGSSQAFGWAGLKIDPTDFEISVSTAEGLPSAATENAAEFAGLKASEWPETGAGIIVFRGNHPDIWDRNTYAGMNSRSRTLADLPEDLAWLRIRRLPSGESVILPVTREGLSGNGEGLACGFNGSNELFYGARHLGAFDETLPQEVETRFTYGGWGFGHRPLGEEKQASTWAGHEIDSDTVFEFTVYGEMPEVDGLLDHLLTAR